MEKGIKSPREQSTRKLTVNLPVRFPPGIFFLRIVVLFVIYHWNHRIIKLKKIITIWWGKLKT